MEVISRDIWLQKAKELFGPDPKKWKFKCSSCGEIQTAQDFITARFKADRAMQLVYQECIGRHVKGRGCDWTLYGLLSIHELEVEHEGSRIAVFRFGE